MMCFYFLFYDMFIIFSNDVFILSIVAHTDYLKFNRFPPSAPMRPSVTVWAFLPVCAWPRDSLPSGRSFPSQSPASPSSSGVKLR